MQKTDVAWCMKLWCLYKTSQDLVILTETRKADFLGLQDLKISKSIMGTAVQRDDLQIWLLSLISIFPSSPTEFKDSDDV